MLSLLFISVLGKIKRDARCLPFWGFLQLISRCCFLFQVFFQTSTVKEIKHKYDLFDLYGFLELKAIKITRGPSGMNAQINR